MHQSATSIRTYCAQLFDWFPGHPPPSSKDLLEIPFSPGNRDVLDYCLCPMPHDASPPLAAIERKSLLYRSGLGFHCVNHVQGCPGGYAVLSQAGRLGSAVLYGARHRVRSGLRRARCPAWSSTYLSDNDDSEPGNRHGCQIGYRGAVAEHAKLVAVPALNLVVTKTLPNTRTRTSPIGTPERY